MPQGTSRNPRWGFEKSRSRVWATLWRAYFKKLIAPNACVLDLGCGQGDFINSVEARRRIAVDVWPDFKNHIKPGVETHVRSASDLGFLDDGSVDFAFASNLFEHLTQAEFAAVLNQLRSKLSREGVLTILQPNYRYAYREYFDDFTHIAVYSHQSLTDFLVANGYEVIDVRPRFLPLSLKSKLPTWPVLIRAYLWSPWHPMGKQMLVRARPLR